MSTIIEPATSSRGVVRLLEPMDRSKKPKKKPPHPEIVVGEDGLARPRWATRSLGLMRYYDTEWGVPVTEDDQMFRLLSLLVLQAGMQWGISLGRAELFDEIFEDFDPLVVASFGEEDEDRFLLDERMIRNRRKIHAILRNAKVAAGMLDHISLAELVWAHRPSTTPVPFASREIPAESIESRKLAEALRRLGFTFVGPRTCYSLMQSAGVVDTNLVGTHRRGISGLWNEDGTPARHLPIESADLLDQDLLAS